MYMQFTVGNKYFRSYKYPWVSNYHINFVCICVLKRGTETT